MDFKEKDLKRFESSIYMLKDEDWKEFWNTSDEQLIKLLTSNKYKQFNIEEEHLIITIINTRSSQRMMDATLDIKALTKCLIGLTIALGIIAIFQLVMMFK